MAALLHMDVVVGEGERALREEEHARREPRVRVRMRGGPAGESGRGLLTGALSRM